MRLRGDKAAARRGFTLVELMVVLVIIGVMAAVIVPEMRGSYQDAILRSTARELASVVDLAASRSVSMNQTLRLQIDSRTGRYEIERMLGETGGPGDFAPLRGVLGADGRFDSRVLVEVKRPERIGEGEEGESPAIQESGGVRFYPDGTCDSATIEISDRAGNRLGLSLNPITARPRVMELDRK